jgi:hypothetical protein
MLDDRKHERGQAASAKEQHEPVANLSAPLSQDQVQRLTVSQN